MIAKYKETHVFYTDKGKGQVIVLLHGFLENQTMWNKISEELSKRNRVIAVDLLGHGKTENIGYIHLMEEMAQAVQSVLKKNKIRRSYFIGHSMGGYVALAFVNLYPKNVKGLCLLNSTSQADSIERKNIRKEANEIAKKQLGKLIKLSISNLFTKGAKEVFSEEIEDALKQAQTITLRGYIAASSGMMLRKNNEEALTQVEKRVIIIGKKDSVLSYSSILNEAERTQTPLIEFPNGHMSHIEDREPLIKFLKQFVK